MASNFRILFWSLSVSTRKTRRPYRWIRPRTRRSQRVKKVYQNVIKTAAIFITCKLLFTMYHYVNFSRGIAYTMMDCPIPGIRNILHVRYNY